MFAGIVETTAPIRAARPARGARMVSIEKPQRWKLAKGESISVDGICTTVLSSTPRSFSVSYMPETLRKTTAGTFIKGKRVNLERSLSLSSRVEGHFVTGHIDARSQVATTPKRARQGFFLTLILPSALMRYVTLHGSLAVNGVSLTVARINGRRVTMALIPHTLSHTNLGALKKGDAVNVEVDLAARYLLSGRGYARLTRDAKKTLRKRN